MSQNFEVTFVLNNVPDSVDEFDVECWLMDQLTGHDPYVGTVGKRFLKEHNQEIDNVIVCEF